MPRSRTGSRVAKRSRSRGGKTPNTVARGRRPRGSRALPRQRRRGRSPKIGR